jgi:hypothetical protein
MTETARTLPSYDLWDGHATSLDIHEPCWLLAGRLTDIDTGESWRFTYLSTWVRNTGQIYQRVLDWLDGALPVGDPQIITDPDMMFGHAEFRLYELRPLDVTA